MIQISLTFVSTGPIDNKSALMTTITQLCNLNFQKKAKKKNIARLIQSVLQC